MFNKKKIITATMCSRYPDDIFSIDCNPSTGVRLNAKKNESKTKAKNMFHVKIVYIWNWKRCQLFIEHCSCVLCTMYECVIWKTKYRFENSILNNLLDNVKWSCSSGLNWQDLKIGDMNTWELQNQANDTHICNCFFFKQK